ncbi:hypothetical protein JW499_22305, partial [Amphritea sp. ZJ14W]
DAHVANAEAGGVVIRTGAWVEWTRAGAVIDDGSHAGTVSDLAAVGGVAQVDAEGLIAFEHGILSGLHGKGLAGHARRKGQ